MARKTIQKDSPFFGGAVSVFTGNCMASGVETVTCPPALSGRPSGGDGGESKCTFILSGGW